VVLPASMCAMMPMLRVRASGVCLGIAVTVGRAWRPCPT